MFAEVLKVALALGLAATTVEAVQTPLWVNKDLPGSDSGAGTQNDPYFTISKAVAVANGGSGVYIITVVEGDYTQAHESSTSFPGFPIALGNNVIVQGEEDEDVDHFPRVGSGVNDSDVRSLFFVDAEAGTRANIEVRNIHFVAEDSDGEDSPSAFLVSVADDNAVSNISFIGNFCECPEMNASGSNGRATVLISAAPGSITGLYITDNWIAASARGGIEFRVREQGATEGVGIGGVVLRNTVKVREGGTALFGMRWSAADPETDVGISGTISQWEDNIIDGSYGTITTGLEIVCAEETSYGHGDIIGNTVRFCAGDGVVLRADGDGTGSNDETEIALQTFGRNRLVGNGGSGLYLWRDESNHVEDEGSGSIHCRTQGNVIIANGEYGIRVRGLGPNSDGSLRLVNDTIADNEGAGLHFEDTQGTSLPELVLPFTNLIMYGNGDADQVSGLSQGLLDDLFDLISESDWEGIPSLANGNIDSDPAFVNPGAYDYHLDILSPCVDNGVASPLVLASIDMDGEGRVQDGNHENCERPAVNEIDMGADEVPDPCNE